MEEINEAFPAVLPGLTAHEGVGFVMVRSRSMGPVVIGAQGKYFLSDDRIEGRESFGELWPASGRSPAAHGQLPQLPRYPGQQLL